MNFGPEFTHPCPSKYRSFHESNGLPRWFDILYPPDPDATLTSLANGNSSTVGTNLDAFVIAERRSTVAEVNGDSNGDFNKLPAQLAAVDVEMGGADVEITEEQRRTQ